MAERRGFLLVAMAVGVIGVGIGTYVVWEMAVRITGP